MPVDGDEAIVAAARAILAATGIEALLVTRSQDGASLITADAVWHLPAEARDVWDVSGAGDTVAAVAAMVLGTGRGLETAARLANAAAGIVLPARAATG